MVVLSFISRFVLVDNIKNVDLHFIFGRSSKKSPASHPFEFQVLSLPLPSIMKDFLMFFFRWDSMYVRVFKELFIHQSVIIIFVALYR